MWYNISTSNTYKSLSDAVNVLRHDTERSFSMYPHLTTEIPIDTDRNREIDKLIAEKVMGWTYLEKAKLNGHSGTDWTGITPTLSRQSIPTYTTDVAAAWTVIKKLKDRDGHPNYLWLSYQGDAVLTKHNSSHWLCAFASPEQFRAEADTAPMAIALAALAAVGVEIKE